MSKDLMRYDLLAQEALRGVVRAAIVRAAEDGLPGSHHFYITFRTRYPGADVDEQLLEKYPEEITIVLEHQFWDLASMDDAFEVTLSFGGAPKYIKVPYAAVTSFHDPAVGFGLKFDMGDPEAMPATTPAPLPATGTDADNQETAAAAGEVVSLDAFRRK
ncbi:MAG: ClpXP protease specificity-enhancing factor SspB [Robiginitomaculum sp.]|nr:ClpXP protease specificity-enhancing factor SspB [Robiginitomaculum sp.]MDQ7077961.1 ClpXP protease specificity-enhancing factor SspB [Robiginitomaculum sp.]